jgi:hypothetical protein
VIDEFIVYGLADELGYFRSHATLDVELCDWHQRPATLTNGQPLELTLVELMQLSIIALEGEILEEVDRWSKLFVVTNLDAVLDSGEKS